MSGVEIPMAGLLRLAGQLGALVEEFSGMVQSNEEVQAAIDMPWMDGTMQHAASDFEGSWDSRRAELLEQLMNYMETVQGVMERWAGYDDTMGMSFEEYLENTPDGQAKLDEITSQTAEGDALWEGTEEKAQVDEQVADLERQIDEMSPKSCRPTCTTTESRSTRTTRTRCRRIRMTTRYSPARISRCTLALFLNPTSLWSLTPVLTASRTSPRRSRLMLQCTLARSLNRTSLWSLTRVLTASRLSPPRSRGDAAVDPTGSPPGDT